MEIGYKWIIKKIIKGNILAFLGMIFIFFAIGILQSGSILIVQKIMRQINSPKEALVIILIIAFIVIQLLRSFEHFISENWELFIQKKVFRVFYHELCGKIHNISILKFDSAQFLVDVERSRKAVDNKIADFIGQIFSLIAIISTMISLCAILVKIDKKFFAYFLIMSIFQNIVLIFNSKDTNRFLKKQDKKWHKEYYYKDLLENREYAKEIRNYNGYDWIVEKRMENYDQIAKEHLGFSKRWSAINIITGILMYLLEGGMFLFVFIYLKKGNITSDVAIMLIQAQILFCTTVFACVEYVMNAKEDFSYIDSFIKIMNTKEQKVNVDAPEHITDKLELKNIFFGYDEKNLVLKNINLCIKKGEKVALVGENGSGKSTLAKIIMGLLLPTKGEISIGKWEKAAIFQDFGRFYLKVKENIFIGNLSADIDEFEDFYKNKKEFQFIENLPNGLDSLLGPEIYENGLELSGGQWQKIALLRALIRNAEIILFDEPTSAMDPVAERECFKEIEELLKDKTVIIITHRIGLTKFADKIVTLQNGQIVEEGTYKELLNNTSIFQKYYMEQSKWYK